MSVYDPSLARHLYLLILLSVYMYLSPCVSMGFDYAYLGIYLCVVLSVSTFLPAWWSLSIMSVYGYMSMDTCGRRHGAVDSQCQCRVL